MSAQPSRARLALARLWTGPAAHLLGGGLDLAGAWIRWTLARLRSRAAR